MDYEQSVLPEEPSDVLVALDESLVSAFIRMKELLADKAAARKKLDDYRKGPVSYKVESELLKDAAKHNKEIRESKEFIFKIIEESICIRDCGKNRKEPVR